MSTFYEAMGGEEFFTKLVHGFYSHVKESEILSPMYPPEDFEGAERRLRMFLEQYWGGPKTYGEERGHPRLRMRHNIFHINPAAKDEWLRCMKLSLDTLDMDPGMREELWSYLLSAADAMVNQLSD